MRDNGNMTTQNLASFPDVLKSIKNMKGPVSIIDSDEEGENLASDAGVKPFPIKEEEDESDQANADALKKSPAMILQSRGQLSPAVQVMGQFDEEGSQEGSMSVSDKWLKCQ